MASHHQPYHSCHHPPPPTPTTSSCYCSCYYTSSTASHHLLLPDPHLPSIAHHPTQSHFFSPYTPQNQTHSHYQPPPHPLPHSHLQNPHHFQQLPLHQKEELTDPQVVSSLLRRISALETTLERYSSSSSSLRDAAARTIQNHFRSFLVRRSRTLGQLKELASIKSTLNALKSAVSGNAHFDPNTLSLKAMDLLLRLDFIQGVDPLVRDGKRSISRELNTLMDFSGGVSAKRSALSSKMAKNIRSGGENNKSRHLSLDKKRANVEGEKVGRRGDEIRKLREEIERISRLSKVSEDDDEEDEELESPAISLVRKNRVSIDKGRGDVRREQLGRRKGLRTVVEEDAEEDEELESPTLYLVKKNGIPINKFVGLTKGNIGSQAKVKKSVRFVEDRNVYRVMTSNLEPAMNEDCDSVDESESVDVEGQITGELDRKVEEIGFASKEMGNDHEEAETEDEGSSGSSNGSSDVNYIPKSRNDVNQKSYIQGENGDFTFSAPLPVKMEPRTDLTNKRSLNA